MLVSDINPIPCTDIVSIVRTICNLCSESDISNSFKIISDLLCFVSVKKVFLCDKKVLVVLGGKNHSVLKLSLEPGEYAILGQRRGLMLVLYVPCFIFIQ